LCAARLAQWSLPYLRRDSQHSSAVTQTYRYGCVHTVNSAPAGVCASATYLRGHWSRDPSSFAARTLLKLPSLCVAEPHLASSLKQRSRAVGTTVAVTSDGPLECRSCSSARLVVPFKLASLDRRSHLHHVLDSRPMTFRTPHPAFNPIPHGARRRCCAPPSQVNHRSSAQTCERDQRSAPRVHPPGGYARRKSGVLPQAPSRVICAPTGQLLLLP